MEIREWADFGWQGVCLQVPEEWNLGKVDGTRKSGYARLDDAEIVRMEVEWREAPAGRRLPIPELVDRYLGTLEKKAQKSDVSFTVRRRAKFLKDKRWLENSEYETFVWEADYRAYNLARACGECGRIVLLRVLARRDESLEDLAGEIFETLRDHSHEGREHWSVYGLTFEIPDDYSLERHDLKSGNIQLTFEKKNHECRIQRLSMAQMLLKGTTLPEWYPRFFRKQLRDFNCEIEESEEAAPGHGGLRVMGKPRSRWRQILRPLPLVNTRPRRHLDGRVWHCVEQNKICIAEHLYGKKDEQGDVTQHLTEAYVCHRQETEAESRSDAEFAPGAQRPADVGKER